jgi:hypothetical protein
MTDEGHIGVCQTKVVFILPVIPEIIFYKVFEFTVSVKEYLAVAAPGW